MIYTNFNLSIHPNTLPLGGTPETVSYARLWLNSIGESFLRFASTRVSIFPATILLLFAFFSTSSIAQDTSAPPNQAVILVVGAEGAEQYKAQFKLWADAWKQSAGHTTVTMIGLDGEKGTSKTQLQQAIEKSIKDDSLQEIWLVMIGHGTFDGKRAKFNLHGPDVEAAELQSWLKTSDKRTVVLNCTSSSSPFINALSGRNRIVISATRNGYETNFARFGQFLSTSIDDPAIDLDKDGQTSVLEAFCAASRGASDFYQQENRIVTEHALLDDNGDKKGTPADWFDGVRATKAPKSGTADGLLANQVFLHRRGVEGFLTLESRKTRDKLESQLEQIRSLKNKMDQSAYLLAIEPVMIQLAELYENTTVAKIERSIEPTNEDKPSNQQNKPD